IELTDARGVGKDFKLQNLKGKWVLIDFWGWWCFPCVRESLPKAISFYESNADKRDKFEILAFHTSDVNTMTDLGPHLRTLQESAWKGMPLPFPILLDGSGNTLKRWNITVYPSSVLIDPAGNIYPGGSLEVLREKLGAR